MLGCVPCINNIQYSFTSPDSFYIVWTVLLIIFLSYPYNKITKFKNSCGQFCYVGKQDIRHLWKFYLSGLSKLYCIYVFKSYILIYTYYMQFAFLPYTKKTKASGNYKSVPHSAILHFKYLCTKPQTYNWESVIFIIILHL